jgi:NAD(P)-dependent dehydrogenase (short-subunit alcohol dehydrogenase family)
VNRSVVITGAAGALGQAIARRLGCQPGAGIVISDLDEAELERARQALADSPAQIRAFPADVTDPDRVDALVDFAVGAHGALDVMVNNAGVLGPNSRIHNLTAADWDRVLRVNLMGVVHGIQAALRVMRPAGAGSIISTASVAGITAWTHSAPYGASKAAIIHLTKTAALEYARDGIRVNCVCPGSFASTMQRALPEGALESVAARHPLGLGMAEDLVGVYAYLASEDSRWTTGSAIVVDGGYSLP